jgi:hypothetical protein
MRANAEDMAWAGSFAVQPRVHDLVPVLFYKLGDLQCVAKLEWSEAELTFLKRLVQNERGCFQTCRNWARL